MQQLMENTNLLCLHASMLQIDIEITTIAYITALTKPAFLKNNNNNEIFSCFLFSFDRISLIHQPECMAMKATSYFASCQTPWSPDLY